jgi:hypothetical protein
MASRFPAEISSDTPQRLALFYRDPHPLSSRLHADWRLKDGDVDFTADAPFVPIVVSELAAAARCYPVVFAASDNTPLALLGLDRTNLFVTDGQWAHGTYVPAYVRRYPFGIIATGTPELFALAIDAGAERIARGGDEGVPLFEDGEPSALTRQALAFCDAFQREAGATREFVAALGAQDLLVDRRVDAALPDGRRFGLDGFRIVDAEKVSSLADEVVLDWHGKGYLAAVHFHLASLDRFSALLGVRAQRDGASAGTGNTPRKPDRNNMS